MFSMIGPFLDRFCCQELQGKTRRIALPTGLDVEPDSGHLECNISTARSLNKWHMASDTRPGSSGICHLCIRHLPLGPVIQRCRFQREVSKILVRVALTGLGGPDTLFLSCVMCEVR